MRPHLLIFILPALATLQAQDHGSITGNPFSTPADRVEGMRLFRSTCAACHGLEGTGGSNGPSLTTLKRGGTDEELFRNITKGVPDTPMVAFPLESSQVWRLITFIRSLNVGKAPDPSQGIPARGAQVFAANGCARCHTVGGAGGFLGPDLSDIGSRRSPAQLESSVLDPNATVSPDYWSLRGRTKSGQAVDGIRMNEDMDSFQIREASGRLRSVWKADLTSYEIVHTSPMPSFKGRLQPGELEDLVAYLGTLRTRGGPAK
jgi:cytochrome c oxidase cbb3-type subunit 3